MAGTVCVRYTFQDALTPGVIRRRGQKMGRQKKEESGGGGVGDDGIFATTFHMDRAWERRTGPVNKEYELSEAHMQLAKNDSHEGEVSESEERISISLNCHMEQD